MTPNVTPMIASRGATLFADQAAMYLIPVVIYLQTGDVTLSGLAFAIEWVPRVASLPFTGALVDSFNVRGQLVGVDVMRATVAISLPLLDSVYALMVAGGLLSLCSGYAMLLGEVVLSRVVAPSAMPAAQGRMQTAVQLSQTAGPVLAGLLLVRFGFELSAVAVGAVFLLGAIWVGAATARLPGLEAPRGKLRLSTVPGNVVAGARTVLGSPALTRLILLTTFVNLVSGLALAALPALVMTRFGGTATTVSIVLSAASLASLAAAVAVTFLVRRVGLVAPIVTAGLGLLGSAYWMAGSGSLIGFAAAYVLWSATLTVYVIWMRTRRLKLLGSESVGSGLGFFVAAILLAAPISGAILAVFGGRFSPQEILFVLALIGTIGCAAILAIEHRATGRARQEVS